MSEELKNKIRRERILEIMYNQKNKLVTHNLNTFYNSECPKDDAYYKSPTQFSLKDVTEDDIINLKNKKIIKDCIDFLYYIYYIKYLKKIKINDNLIKLFKESDALLTTYLYFIKFQIKELSPSYNEVELKSIDELEEMLDELIALKRKENKEKSWWNIF